MADTRLIVLGAGGRMGRNLIKAIAETAGAKLVGAIEAPTSANLGEDSGLLAGLKANGVAVTSDLAAAAKDADAIIDFTVPSVSLAAAKIAAANNVAHVIGTTGCSASDDAAIAEAAQKCAIVKSGNMSLGVNLLAALVERVAKTLDSNFDIEIVEMHHRAKVDAPSGTALLLGEAAARGRNVKLADRSVRSRDGHTGARNEGDIGFAALRGGTVIGDHNVIFAGPYERIELNHKAEDRQIFARGAVKAALWAHGRKPGLYSMADVLGLGDM